MIYFDEVHGSLMFQAEYWGSGIKRITDACKEYGSPIPEIVNEAGGVAVKCRASDSYLKAMKGENNSTVLL